jgi:hypothetical protein
MFDRLGQSFNVLRHLPFASGLVSGKSGHGPLCRRERKCIGAAVEAAFTLTLQSEYPTATQQE